MSVRRSGELAGALVALALLLVASPERAGAQERDLGARIEAILDEASAAEADIALAQQARRALLEADRLRGLGDLAGAMRAEAIARAAVELVERRAAVARARRELESARVERDAARAAAGRARERRTRAEADAARLAGGGG